MPSDSPLDEYEAILPEPERTRFREDVDRLIRRTLAHDHAHQTVHLAWLSARATADRILEAIARCPREDGDRLETLNRLSVKAEAVEAGLQEIDRQDMGEAGDRCPSV